MRNLDRCRSVLQETPLSSSTHRRSGPLSLRYTFRRPINAVDDPACAAAGRKSNVQQARDLFAAPAGK